MRFERTRVKLKQLAIVLTYQCKLIPFNYYILLNIMKFSYLLKKLTLYEIIKYNKYKNILI